MAEIASQVNPRTLASAKSASVGASTSPKRRPSSRRNCLSWTTCFASGCPGVLIAWAVNCAIAGRSGAIFGEVGSLAIACRLFRKLDQFYFSSAGRGGCALLCFSDSLDAQLMRRTWPCHHPLFLAPVKGQRAVKQLAR